MPTYTVEALDSSGKRVKTEVDAGTPNEAVTKLRAKGYRPMNIREKAAAAAPPGAPAPGAGGNPPTSRSDPASTTARKGGGPTTARTTRKLSGFSFGRRVSHKHLTQFTQQLSVLLDAGLPIVRSLKILARQMKPGYFKQVVTEVSEDVEQGFTLSDALAKHPRVFDRLFVSMARAGEAGGVLDLILQRLAHFMERIEALKRKVISASVYPSVVIVIAFSVVWAIMTFIVPKFISVFKDLGKDLPPMTEMLKMVSEFFTHQWYLVIGLPVIAVIVLISWSRTAAGKVVVDRLKLRFPLVGSIIKRTVIARFCRTLGTLLQSGVPILDALRIVRNASGNEVIGRAIQQVHDSIREGESIAGPLAQSGVFDDVVINMIDVGEETGELDKMLLKVADVYENEADAALTALMSVLEPVIIVCLGLVVGFIVVALFMPLISLVQNLQGR